MAAVLGEVGKQAVHGGVLSRVDKGAALAPKGDQPGMPELVQVERQGRRRQGEPVPNVARGHTARSSLDQKAENIEAGLLGERRKGSESTDLLHIFRIMEITGLSIPSVATDHGDTSERSQARGDA